MENPPKPLKFAPKIALAVCIGLLDDNYKKVAYHLNDKGKTEIKVKNIAPFKLIASLSIFLPFGGRRDYHKVHSSPFFGELII